MKRITVLPSQIDFESPGRRDYWVALEHDSIWGQYHIPLTVWIGTEVSKGEGLVAFGANHGNEYEGPIILKHLLKEIDISDVLGRIILIPVLNPAAFKGGFRESIGADNVNLNRAFVDGAGVSQNLSGITYRIVDFVRRYIWPNVHIVIDIHAGGEVARFSRLVSFHHVEEIQQADLMTETARCFETPFIVIYQNFTPGLLTSESEALGKITLGCELGWGTSISVEGVSIGRNGVLGAAIKHNQIRERAFEHYKLADDSQRIVEMIKQDCFVPAPWPGHYEPLINCGKLVKLGELVGLLHDFNRIDDPPEPIKSKVDGYVIAQAWRAPVEKGQHIVVIGIPIK